MKLKEVELAVKDKVFVTYQEREYMIESLNMYPKSKAVGKDIWIYKLGLRTCDLRGFVSAPMEFVKRSIKKEEI